MHTTVTTGTSPDRERTQTVATVGILAAVAIGCGVDNICDAEAVHHALRLALSAAKEPTQNFVVSNVLSQTLQGLCRQISSANHLPAITYMHTVSVGLMAPAAMGNQLMSMSI